MLTVPRHFRGPLISPHAKRRVESLIGSVEDDGGKIHLDGRKFVVKGYERGNFVGPTVVEAVTTMKAYKYARPRNFSPECY